MSESKNAHPHVDANAEADAPEATEPGATKPGAVRGAERPNGSVKGRLAGNLFLFTLARLAIVVVLTAIIEGLGYLVTGGPVPLLAAILIALVVAMPLSAVLLRRWSRKINADIATVDAGRREKKADLRRRMSQ